MGSLMLLLIALVTIVTVIFFNFPAPEFSAQLKKWYKNGKSINYKNFKIFYRVEDGVPIDGDTLLCIHGFPTSSYDWTKILDGLKERYSTIILPDMLGFGLSDKPRNHDYLITEQADILEAILKSLSVKEAHVLSHDYGDTVALELLHRHNSNSGNLKMKSLCMLNGGVFPETNFPRPGQKVLLLPYIGKFLSHISFYGVFRRGLGEVFGPQTMPTEDEMRDFYAILRYKDGNTVTSELLDYIRQRSENKERWVGALQRAQTPVHMIYGPADVVNPPVFVDHYKKIVPNPSIHVLEDSIGHYPQWEDPAGVMRAYAAFLEKVQK